MNLEFLSEVLAIGIGQFTLGELLLSFGIVLLTVFFRGIVVRALFTTLKRVASHTRWQEDDNIINALEKPTYTFVLVFGIYMALVVLPLQAEWESLINTLFRAGSVLVVFWGILRLADVLVDMLSHLPSTVGGDVYRGFGTLIKKSLRIFIVLVGAVMVLDNLGYDVGGVLATLGIGGAALALAAKDTIANIYGSISLAMDRPFRVGDWIQVGDKVDGDVEEIGLRSTKVRTWPKTVISIPNAVLANEMIDNWSRMPKRRVKQVVGVTYDTSPGTMVRIVDGIRKILREDNDVNQEFILVNWTDFGSSSLDILVYYFTVSTRWLEHMDVRQRINVKIAELIQAEGSSIAFPTRTLYLEGDVARKLAGGVELPHDRGPQTPL